MLYSTYFVTREIRPLKKLSLYLKILNLENSMADLMVLLSAFP